MATSGYRMTSKRKRPLADASKRKHSPPWGTFPRVRIPPSPPLPGPTSAGAAYRNRSVGGGVLSSSGFGVGLTSGSGVGVGFGAFDCFLVGLFFLSGPRRM